MNIVNIILEKKIGNMLTFWIRRGEELFYLDAHFTGTCNMTSGEEKMRPKCNNFSKLCLAVNLITLCSWWSYIWREVCEYKILPALGRMVERNTAHVATSVQWERNVSCKFYAISDSRNAVKSYKTIHRVLDYQQKATWEGIEKAEKMR